MFKQICSVDVHCHFLSARIVDNGVSMGEEPTRYVVVVVMGEAFCFAVVAGLRIGSRPPCRRQEESDRSPTYNRWHHTARSISVLTCTPVQRASAVRL